jgi:hypothetical protein
MPWLARTVILLIRCASWEYKCEPPHLAFYHWDGVSQTFCHSWPQTVILLISTSQVARITGVSHHVWPTLWVLTIVLTCTYHNSILLNSFTTLKILCALTNDEESCYKHLCAGFCVDRSLQFIGINGKVLDCWIVWSEYV